MERKHSIMPCNYFLENSLHGKYLYLFIYFVLFLLLFTSCGIEEYIYLYPVNTPTNTEIDNYIKFNLPVSQPNSVFTGYRIYYRIYLSDNNASTRNILIDSDWNKISQANLTPALISNILENTLSYKQLSFYKDNTETRAYPLTTDSTGLKYKIDFNISSVPNYVVLINYDSSDDTKENYFQICRNSDSQTKLLFEYPVTSSEVDDISKQTDDNEAYVQFVIVATGFNSGTIIMSEVTRLGVLILPSNQ